MARPKKYHEPRVATAVRLPMPLWERLVEVAAERDTSMNHLLCKAAAIYLDKGLPPLGPEDVPEPPPFAPDHDAIGYLEGGV